MSVISQQVHSTGFRQNYAQQQPINVLSPDAKYEFRFTLTNGKPTYSLQFDNQPIVLPSLLGIKAGIDWSDDVALGDVLTSQADSIWHPVYGERSTIRDYYASCEIELRKGGSRLFLDVRTYNEGVAFRYRFSGNSYLRIDDELTEFVMPAQTMAYFTPRAQTPYQLLPLTDWPTESDRPLLLRLSNNDYVCLAEAAVSDYVRTKFALSSIQKNTILTSMYGPVEDIAPFATPWRVIMCGHRAADILQHNDLILNLNPPCEIKDTSWIKPGKAMREVSLNTERAKSLVDFAVKHNIQYIHFDAGWYGHEYDRSSDATTVTVDPKRNPQFNPLNLPEVISYAKSKGIGVFLYVNQRALQQQLRQLLPLYKSWGIAGIKFGFVHVGSYAWTRWMHEAVRMCADYQLMVDIHDEYRPTGFSRTYPNLLTQEGIRGNEEFPDATHNVTLPFTRFVAGAADYTICYYSQDFDRLAKGLPIDPADTRRILRTTPAHQLALSVVYYSPLQFMYWYDSPLKSQDEPEMKFFDDVHTVWDDTRILDGEVGKHITTARRHGKEWFVGAITGNMPREHDISLSFLQPGVEYKAEIYTDGDPSIPTRTKVKVQTMNVSSQDTLHFRLKPSGGVAIRLIPTNESI
ncbi:MAG: glycoside hydrolase family 97 catalytic domain-containing protein [Bacteroidales bacterium]|nr:glycoside hydrolase family 97 catalytic domain-containing protein [Bacteroidales bacterium]